MGNKIIFLGTGGDSFVVAKQMRASGGIIIQDGDIQLHVDPGPGALVRAASHGINLRETTALLVSSNDYISAGDINHVIDSMTYGGLDKKGVLVSSSSLLNGYEKMSPILSSFHKECLEKYMVLSPGQKIAIENLEIHAVPCFNEDPNAIAFKIFTTESVIGYTGQTKYSKELINSFKGVDILILNVLNPGTEKQEFRLNTEEAIKIIREVSPALAIIRNFGIKMIKLDPIIEGREIQRITGVQTISAKDGMALSPNSYSAKSKQMRLNLFPQNEPPQAKASFTTEVEQDSSSIEELNEHID